MAVKTQRHSYGKLKETLKIPNLVKIQLDSYSDLLQRFAPKTKRRYRGLEALFSEVFPITSQDGRYKLEYLYYELGQPK